jgi:uncharacterized protein (DUF305 family)
MKHYKFFLYLITAALLGMNNSSAQTMHHIDMHRQHHPAKNVFVSMMDTMMISMDTVKHIPSADITFLRLMRPHHSGALAMARFEISNGANAEMKALAQSIYTEQLSEINLMKILERQIPDANENLSAHFITGMDKAMQQMMDDMPADLSQSDVDHAFALVMIPHHQAGIDMAKVALGLMKDRQAIAYAKQLISNQQVEIDQMLNYINSKK